MIDSREQFERTERLIGKEALEKLSGVRVLLFGVGGVGSYVAEGLVRAGIGSITIVDKDVVDITNLNRQIPALYSTVGKSKVEVMADRLKDINKYCEINTEELFFMPDNHGGIDFASYDYVIDAVDTVTAKLEIIQCARNAQVPVISSMGTGRKLDAGAFKITTIEKTCVCPLAKVMRKELKARGIKNVKVLYSEEEPKGPDGSSISFVPSVAGLLIAGEVVKDIIG